MSNSLTTTVELVRTPIDTAFWLAQATRPDCGAVLLFLGTTREWTGDHQTVELEYESYEEMARREMERLIVEARKRWDLRHVALVHRLGRVPLQEASIAIIVSSPHRQAAFDAGKWLIDTFKETVPIWKKDFTPRGESSWIHPSATEIGTKPGVTS